MKTSVLGPSKFPLTDGGPCNMKSVSSSSESESESVFTYGIGLEELGLPRNQPGGESRAVERSALFFSPSPAPHSVSLFI